MTRIIKPVWCVQGRHGWCATSPNNKPAESASSVMTRCDHFIVLPFGTKRGEPTCAICIALVMRAQARKKIR